MAERLVFTDISDTAKWRVFEDAPLPGTSTRSGDELRWSVSPGEATVVGPPPHGDVVDLTHVRAMFRVSGDEAPAMINRVCGLDLDDAMFPDGAAARTLFAGVATEMVRDDIDGARSYLLLPSRSFSVYVQEVIADAGLEFGL